MRVNYILECLSTLPTMEQLKEIKFKTKPELSFAQPVAPNVVQENGLNSSDWGRPRVYTETELHDLTKSVMDTLPHLGDGKFCTKVLILLL